MSVFSDDAFTYALQRNHLFTVAEKDIVRKEIENFSLNNEQIRIQDHHDWHLTPARRNKIDEIYSNFSIQDWYGIQAVQRITYPDTPTVMFEPWMLLEQEDEPGIVDFEHRKNIKCSTDIQTRNYLSVMALLKNKKPQDF